MKKSKKKLVLGMAVWYGPEGCCVDGGLIGHKKNGKKICLPVLNYDLDDPETPSIAFGKLYGLLKIAEWEKNGIIK